MNYDIHFTTPENGAVRVAEAGKVEDRDLSEGS
jgi:hypothetical protein